MHPAPHNGTQPEKTDLLERIWVNGIGAAATTLPRLFYFLMGLLVALATSPALH